MNLSPEDRDAYIGHRTHIVESRRLAYEQFDKAVFLLAGGGLTISLTLIEKIIPFSAAEYKFALIASWSFFTLSILMTLWSFLTSQRALDLELDKVDSVLSTGDTTILETENPYSIKTEILNKLSFYSLIAAILTLVTFVGINVSENKSITPIDTSTPNIEVKNMSKTNNNGQRGYVPPTPPKPPTVPNNHLEPGSGYVPPQAPIPAPRPPEK